MTKRLLPTLVVMLLAVAAVGQSYKQLVSKIRPSVVAISVQTKTNGEFDHYGTGWLYKDQHIIVTAAHVVNTPYTAMQVTFDDGQKASVVQIKLSKVDDVAVLFLDKSKVKGKNRPTLRMATKAPDIGELIAYCGFPMEYPFTARIGYVAHYTTMLAGEPHILRMGYPELGAGGFSGSAVVNEFAEVVGIHVQRDGRMPGFNFAVPHSTLTKILKDWGL